LLEVVEESRAKGKVNGALNPFFFSAYHEKWQA
jgi:hypothetical protein